MNVIVKVTDQVTIEESKTPSRTVHSHSGRTHVATPGPRSRSFGLPQWKRSEIQPQTIVRLRVLPLYS